MSEFYEVGLAAQKARVEFTEQNPHIFEPYSVLDNGFVRLVDWMGSDSRIVQTARVSYGAGTKTVREDRQLIRYLMRHRHTSPFEHCEVAFHVKLPLFVFAQLVRHRMANVNSQSARYSVMKDEFYIPTSLRKQSKTNRQGSEGEVDETELTQLIIEAARRGYETYEELLGVDVAREQARMVLSQNLYTEVYWKQDLHNLFHMLKLRTDSHAQQEIQEYANAMYEITKQLFPIAVEAWEDYSKDSVYFSALETSLLRCKSEEEFSEVLTSLIVDGSISRGEAREIDTKFRRLNLWTKRDE